VARLTRRRYPPPVLPEEVRGLFTDMGRIAVDFAVRREAVTSGDPLRTKRIRDDDDEMDELHRTLFAVMAAGWTHGAAAAAVG
jgi:phosphate transport system protein